MLSLVWVPLHTLYITLMSMNNILHSLFVAQSEVISSAGSFFFHPSPERPNRTPRLHAEVLLQRFSKHCLALTRWGENKAGCLINFITSRLSSGNNTEPFVRLTHQCSAGAQHIKPNFHFSELLRDWLSQNLLQLMPSCIIVDFYLDCNLLHVYKWSKVFHFFMIL